MLAAHLVHTKAMSPDRKPKRERKKAARDARREQWMAAVRRRRRQRWGVLLGSLAVIGIGLLIATLAMRSDEPDQVTPTDDASATDTIAAPVKEPVACDADLPEAAGSKKEQYAEPDDQELDPDETYIWTLETSCGDIAIELDVERAPETANSVAFLTREGFYDGLLFHRIVKDFVLQGGDPQGNGQGGPGYDVVEPPPEELKYEEGLVAMAKSGQDPSGTSGSQFYIVSGDGASSLPPIYALLGKVIDGQDVIDEIESHEGGDIGAAEPAEWVYIERATITVQE